jgi:hypothetical protein
MLFQRLSVLLVLFLTTLSSHAAEATRPKLSLLPPLAAVAAEPAVAPPGTPRKIIIAGLWPTACAPSLAQLGLPPSWAVNQGIGILLTEPFSLVACAAALTPYRFELDYTPTKAGQVEILVMTSRASPLATGTLVTGDAQSPKAFYDVTGAWYDPQTTGSGLQVIHDYGQSDMVFATWQVFDPATGLARWYALQQGQWEADGLAWRGLLYDVKGDPSSCTAPCASPLSHVGFAGVVRLTFSPSYVHGGLDAAMDLVPAGGPPQRLSNLVRLLPHRIVIQ